MASTWSALKVELQGTGDNSGTWGTLTNTNLGDAVLGEAITGSATVNFPSAADVTITLTDVATTQSARNLRLNITESGAGIGYVGNLILGSGCQIEKFYLVKNNGTGAKTIKNTTGTGILVPAGTTTLVYNDGTNVVDAVNSFSSAITGAELTGSVIPFYFGSTLPTAGQANHGAVAHLHSTGKLYYSHSSAWQIITSGLGTADTSGNVTPVGSAGQLLTNNGSGGLTSNTTGTGVVTALGVNTGTAGAFVVNGGALGTPSSGTLTLATGLPLTSGVTGLLPIANGGTATATPALVAGTGVTISGSWPNQTINATGTGGTVTSVSGTGTVNGLTLTGTVTSSGSLTLGGTLSGVANAALTNSSVTVTAGTGMSGGGAVALGSSITLTNAGVTSNVAGTGISVSGATGAVTITNAGVTSIVAGTGISISGATGAVTVTSTASGGTTILFAAFSSTGETYFASQGF